MNSYLSYYAYNCHGKVDDGFATSLKALEVAESSGDILSRAAAYVCHGIGCFYKGFLEDAEEHLLKGVDLCERIQWHSFLAIGHQGLGDAYYELGEYGKSQMHCEKAILFRQQTGIFPTSANLNKMALARAALAEGKADPDIPSLVPLLRTNKLKLNQGTIARHLVEILVNLGQTHFVEAESWLQEAILVHEQRGMKWDLASDYKIFARLLKLQGRTGEETGYLEKALSLFGECGAEGWCRTLEPGSAKK